MIIKIKNIARKGISLVLALTIMMPTGAFAGTETQSKWDDYKDVLKVGIMKQQNVITTEFVDGIRFASEGIAIQAIAEAYNEAIKEVPNYFEINIADIKRGPIIEKNANDSYLLKQVKHDVTYYNNFESINNALSVLYAEINTKQTYYEKIRTAYDYIIEQLEYETNSENHNILSSINKDGGVSAKAYAMLFSIIMDKLGYENLIVIGKIKGTTDHAWNLIKIQGNWYHIDSKLGDVNYFLGDRDKYFLTSNEIMVNSEYKHEWENDHDAERIYDIDKNLEYEMGFIGNRIQDSQIVLEGESGNGGIKAEIKGIETYEDLKSIVEKIDIIKEKVKGYENSIEVLREEIRKIADGERKNLLEVNFKKLETSITHISTEIATQYGNIDILKTAIQAVEKAEITRIQTDFHIADGLVRDLTNDKLKTSLNSRLNPIKAEIDAKEAVEVVEKSLKENKIIAEVEIEDAKLAIEGVENNLIKTQLQSRINVVEIAIEAIETVSAIEGIIEKITSEPDELLADIIKEAETAVKTAELNVKNIKDTVVKAYQQNRIKEIKLVITAIKAVEKAETTPLKSTNVKSARTAVGNIGGNYLATKDALNKRLDDVLSAIGETDAIVKAVKAVEKAEKYMKDNDIALAKAAVNSLPVGITKDELNNRIDAIYAAKAVEKAEKSMKDTDITIAKDAVDLLPDGLIKVKLENRISAMDAVVTAGNNLKMYLEESSDENRKKLDDGIADANEAISKILDLKIQNVLVNKLNEINAKDVVDSAEKNLKNMFNTSKQNIEAVAKAVLAVNKLPTGTIKTNHQTTIKELNSAIKTKQIVETAEAKEFNKTLTAKDVIAAEKAILNVNQEYIPGLKDRVDILRAKFEEKEAVDLLKKAIEAVDKAMLSRITKDITTAKKAISLLMGNEEYIGEDGGKINKAILTKAIEELEINIAEEAMSYAEVTRVTKDITSAKKLIDAISIKEGYKDDKDKLNARFKAMESYLATIKILVDTEKYRNLENEIAAKTALDDFKEVANKVNEKDSTIYETVYKVMITDIEGRLEKIGTYLADETKKVTFAETAVKNAEDAMQLVIAEDGTKVIEEPDNDLIKASQEAVNIVTDKTLRAGLQKRIDAIQIAKDAKLAVARAVAYPNEKSVKDAETALSKVDGRYSDIIKFLSEEIAKLRNQLDIAKKVEEASKLVQKAVDSRKASDVSNASFAVDAIEELAPKSYEILNEILVDLKSSIDNASEIETDALAAAQEALTEVFDIINAANTYIAQIIEGEEIIEGEDGKVNKIQEAYEKIESAKIEIIKANAAVRKLTDQKALLAEIDYANKEIELAEDNIDVKEAVRLVKVASSSVNDAKTEEKKSLARLDIAAARRAIDKIGHSNNKAIKTTILNTINSIEKKLTTDNDQELIDAAVIKVNEAADMVTKAVRENTVIADQEVIDKTIFAAKMAIGWISDNNKAAKDTLTGFINDIEALFTAEKDGIKNEERIKNAENAVKEAESKKGSDELESYIRSARLRIKIIKNDGPDTAAKIEDLNTRLDILEGKKDGSDGNGKPGGGSNSGGNKPGGTSTGNIIPTTPLPDSKRVIGTTEPIWGKTKELKKPNPTTGVSIQDMTIFRVNESKLKTIELSNMLKTTPNANAKLVVRGKNIKLDSKPYINDKVNNSILVPVKTLGDELGFTVSLIDSPVASGSKRLLINVLVYGESKSIIMDIGSEYCYVNGILVKISSKPVIQDGRTYIPVDFMVEHLGLSFSYYNESGTIQLIIN